MSKDVNRVRKAIEQRKKVRHHTIPSVKEDAFLFHDAEEKHGFPPEMNGYAVGTKKSRVNKELYSSIMFKAIFAGILFFSTAILFNTDKAFFAKPKEIAVNLLQDEFPFAKVNIWYQDMFGSPLAFSPQSETNTQVDNEGVMPVSGDITETFQVNGKGVKISPGKEVDVSAHQDGVVIFAGKSAETGKTIIVQHADGTNSSYGFLNEFDVHMYQYVTASQRIGKFIPETEQEAMYFSIEKENLFLDPVEVIEVDDVP
ncbi:peptidoglycan DD-metalloendopeptidase family protein [Oceanobacillus sp. FSL H7-0719]|uniref:peptidoglycan DD-metalloendopeptidase family protein n=1 Tax=Oceanobacillus sp. FSL H7-0719 TaxID=2954507 RepID=UPI0032556820